MSAPIAGENFQIAEPSKRSPCPKRAERRAAAYPTLPPRSGLIATLILIDHFRSAVEQRGTSFLAVRKARTGIFPRIVQRKMLPLGLGVWTIRTSAIE